MTELTVQQNIDEILQMPLQDLLDNAEAAVAVDDASLSACADAVKLLRERRLAVDKSRKEWVEPLNAQVKKFNSMFKPAIDKLKMAEDSVKKRMVDYQTEREREAMAAAEAEAKAERERLAEEAVKHQQEGNDIQAEYARRELKNVQSQKVDIGRGDMTGAKSYVRSTWSWELVDIQTVPPEFLQIDRVKVNKAVREGVRNIEGLNIFEEKKIGVR